MDIKKVLSEAVKAVEDAGVPDDLRQVAFEKAIELATAGLVPQMPTAMGSDALVVREPALKPEDADSPLSRIAGRLSLPYDLVSEVFYLDGDDIGIGLPTSSFERSDAGATRQLALLVAAARQAAGLEEWTRSTAIRAICQEYGRFDTANFATTVRSMGSWFSYRGKGRNLEVKVTRPGIEKAAELVRELRGAE